jgi:hypothetical protein
VREELKIKVYTNMTSESKNNRRSEGDGKYVSLHEYKK